MNSVIMMILLIMVTKSEMNKNKRKIIIRSRSTNLDFSLSNSQLKGRVKCPGFVHHHDLCTNYTPDDG